METEKDPILWKMAHQRAGFKSHLFTYLVVIAGLWVLWGTGIIFRSGSRYPWPIWPTFGWGIGLLSHFAGIYIFKENQLVEREYQKLLKNQSRL